MAVPMKIVILINGLYPETIGGIEKIGSELAPLLARKHEVVVYTAHSRNLPANEIRNNFKIKRITSSYNLKIRLPLGIRLVNTIRQLGLEEKKPDVILSMSIGKGFTGYVASKRYGIPFVIYVLGSDWSIVRDRRFRGVFFRLGLKKCKRVVAQSNIVKNDILSRFPQASIEVVPNGITLPRKKANGDKIVFLGRLNKVKGIEYLIDAVRKIENCPELVIAGSGPEEAELKNRAKGLNVKFAGRIPDANDLYMQGRFFVLPSLSEGLPQVVLEAMSFGLPVIATRVGGIPDVIKHGRTGFLVEPGDSEDIRKYIELLLADERLCRHMSEECMAEVEMYSWDTIAARIEAVLQDASVAGAVL
jgi:glycosyltransferase involved in cell wall biosynthesis